MREFMGFSHGLCYWTQLLLLRCLLLMYNYIWCNSRKNVQYIICQSWFRSNLGKYVYLIFWWRLHEKIDTTLKLCVKLARFKLARWNSSPGSFHLQVMVLMDLQVYRMCWTHCGYLTGYSVFLLLWRWQQSHCFKPSHNVLLHLNLWSFTRIPE